MANHSPSWRLDTLVSILLIIIGSTLFGMGVCLIFTSHILVGIVLCLIGIILVFSNATKLIKLIGKINSFLTELCANLNRNNNTSNEIHNLDSLVEINSQITIALKSKSSDTITTELNEKARRDFIANISHDLRTPLTSIRGYVETIEMKDSSLSVEERGRYLDTITKNIDYLVSLVDDLFTLGKLDANDQELTKQPFCISELCLDIIDRLKHGVDKKNISLTLHGAEERIPVKANRKMIERVIANLLQNAIYYTPNNGHIDFKIQYSQTAASIKIADTGVGIPDADIPRLGEQFYRVNKDRSRSTGGTGLGLAICYKILERHNSKLQIESKLNHGTTVQFSLPLA